MRKLSDELRRDLAAALKDAAAVSSIIEVSQLAETIRQRHEAENVALEDIEALIAQQAGMTNSPMLFDREPNSSFNSLEPRDNGNSVELSLVESTVVVRIVESGVLHEREFEREDFARSFADGQRLRLGLPKDACPADQ